MNFSNDNPLSSFKADDEEEQIIKNKADYYNKSKELDKVELVHDALQNIFILIRSQQPYIKFRQHICF
ncbi:unnamed protein product [Paramecium sonneborni]|uniref:Uncharacterized protein n=1 Tax=Paramecium sonneborni TaxID=65129 RepID=A0A8S1QXQ3_9CILI|nr:unnamed protein product [Paramecium sonneborni]